jgi:histidine triad (HIT) family protein
MCIFCKIVNHEIPSSILYEDENYLAILDISQVTLGHTLVLPKKHFDNILEMTSNEFKDYSEVIHKVAKIVNNKTNCKGMNILNNTNEIAGQTVNHVHFHIIPRYSNEDSICINFNKSDKQDLNKVLQLLTN